jgi:hypothetical protein
VLIGATCGLALDALAAIGRPPSVRRPRSLVDLGRMYGDPEGVPNALNGSRVFYDARVRVGGAAFPSHYGETNFAVRAGMRFCSATLRLEPGCEGEPTVAGGTCSAAFVHTGHGRGYGLEKIKAARTPEDADQVRATRRVTGDG